MRYLHYKSKADAARRLGEAFAEEEEEEEEEDEAPAEGDPVTELARA